jgi:hypothetical protein
MCCIVQQFTTDYNIHNIYNIQHLIQHLQHLIQHLQHFVQYLQQHTYNIIKQYLQRLIIILNLNLDGINLPAKVYLVLDCDADGFKCVYMIGHIMMEGLLQNAEELQAAIQAFMVRLDACLVSSTYGKQSWRTGIRPLCGEITATCRHRRRQAQPNGT